jgi:osmotically-inducible protein OsmY
MTITQDSPDHRLKALIEEELAWTPAINAAHIGVAVDGGAVSLSGDVASYPEKEAAVKATLRIRGVLAVADEISVHTRWGLGPRDDIDIAREAVATLNGSVVIPKGSVQATVQDGEVTLTGEVAWHYQREATRHAVAVLPGVVLVHNDVTLIPAVTSRAHPQCTTERREHPDRGGRNRGHPDRNRALVGRTTTGRPSGLVGARGHRSRQSAQRRLLIDKHPPATLRAAASDHRPRRGVACGF